MAIDHSSVRCVNTKHVRSQYKTGDRLYSNLLEKVYDMYLPTIVAIVRYVVDTAYYVDPNKASCIDYDTRTKMPSFFDR